MWRKLEICTVLFTGLVAALPARAELITAITPSAGGTIELGFDAVAAGVLPAGQRLELGGAADGVFGVRAAEGELVVGQAGSPDWALGSNGSWRGAQGYVGVRGGADADAGIYASLVFDFGSQRVSQVGALLNFNPDYTYGAGIPLPMYLAAYDAAGRLLDGYELRFATPSAINGAAFYGIAEAAPTIASFEVSAPYAVVDQIRFATPVPEAGALLMALAGLGVLWRARRPSR